MKQSTGTRETATPPSTPPSPVKGEGVGCSPLGLLASNREGDCHEPAKNAGFAVTVIPDRNAPSVVELLIVTDYQEHGSAGNSSRSTTDTETVLLCLSCGFLSLS